MQLSSARGMPTRAQCNIDSGTGSRSLAHPRYTRRKPPLTLCRLCLARVRTLAAGRSASVELNTGHKAPSAGPYPGSATIRQSLGMQTRQVPSKSCRGQNDSKRTITRRRQGVDCSAKRKFLADQPTLVLKPGKARLFWDGAPTVYRGAVDTLESRESVKTGDAVTLVDANKKPIGWGFYNADSLYCLRVVQWATEADWKQHDHVGDIISKRVASAVNLRASIGLPSPETDIYRLINSEGDRLSGLIVDAYGRNLVAASSAAWVEMHRNEIEKALQAAMSFDSLEWRPLTELLKLEGIESSSKTHAEEVADPDKQNPRFATAKELGLKYKIDLRYGQKTGFYSDQRDSRVLIRSLSREKRVLDLCCYTGGFALNAAAANARSVTGVDSSAAAIGLAEENMSFLTEVNAADCVEFVKAPIEDFMRSAAAEGRQWDTVILDPPKLAPNKKALPRAKRKYISLNTAALRLVAPGGLFMTCSCSGAVRQGEGLLPFVQEAANGTGRRLALLRSAGAALDHPCDPAYPEGQYLTNLLFRVT